MKKFLPLNIKQEILKSGNVQGIKNEDFWNKFFEELEKNVSSGKASENGSDSDIIIKPDGSRVL